METQKRGLSQVLKAEAYRQCYMSDDPATHLPGSGEHSVAPSPHSREMRKESAEGNRSHADMPCACALRQVYHKSRIARAVNEYERVIYITLDFPYQTGCIDIFLW